MGTKRRTWMAAIVIAACGWAAPMAIGADGHRHRCDQRAEPAAAPHGDGSGGGFEMRDPDYPGLRCVDYTTGATLSGPDNQWGNGDRRASRRAASTRCTRRAKRWTCSSTGSALTRRQRVESRRADLRVGMPATQTWSSIGTELRDRPRRGGRWAASMDVVGGALRHAVYPTKRMGQLAQAGRPTSPPRDIFGAMTEAYANQPASFDPPDYSVGEEITVGGGGPHPVHARPVAPRPC